MLLVAHPSSGKAAIESWLRRFASLRPEFTVHEVAVAGPPWNMRFFIRFSDRISLPTATSTRTRGMEHIAIRYGLIREIRVYLDTEKVTALDAQPDTAGEPEAARSSVLTA